MYQICSGPIGEQVHLCASNILYTTPRGGYLVDPHTVHFNGYNTTLVRSLCIGVKAAVSLSLVSASSMGSSIG